MIPNFTSDNKWYRYIRYKLTNQHLVVLSIPLKYTVGELTHEGAIEWMGLAGYTQRYFPHKVPDVYTYLTIGPIINSSPNLDEPSIEQQFLSVYITNGSGLDASRNLFINPSAILFNIRVLSDVVTTDWRTPSRSFAMLVTQEAVLIFSCKLENFLCEVNLQNCAIRWCYGDFNDVNTTPHITDVAGNKPLLFVNSHKCRWVRKADDSLPQPVFAYYSWRSHVSTFRMCSSECISRMLL